MNSILSRPGLAAATRPWRFVAAWAAVALVAFVAASASGGTFEDDYSLPGTNVQQATDLLAERLPERAGTDVQIVVHSETRPIPGDVLGEVAQRASQMDDVTRVAPAVLSPDGRTALMAVQYGVQLGKRVPVEELDKLEAAAKPAGDAGSTTEFGGQLIDQIFEPGRS